MALRYMHFGEQVMRPMGLVAREVATGKIGVFRTLFGFSEEFHK